MGVPSLDHVNLCKWMQRHWGSFPSFSCLTNVVLWLSTTCPFIVVACWSLVQFSHSTSLMVSEEIKCWRHWSREIGRPHWGKGMDRERLSNESYRTGLCSSQRLQNMLLVNRPWNGCWNFHGLGIGWRGARLLHVIVFSSWSGRLSRECMSNRFVTLGWRSRSSSREDVRTWNSSCASCSSNELMCHLYSLRTSRRHPASSTSSSPGSSLDRALRSWSSVVDSWLSLQDWIEGRAANFSSHLMNDGHAAKPWSNEFRKQVFPKFKRPGAIPLFLFFRSVIGPHKTYTPAAIAAAIPPMTPQFFIILFRELRGRLPSGHYVSSISKHPRFYVEIQSIPH